MFYVNLHPTANYSVMMIGNGGKLVDIKEYIKNVDWLFWAGRRQLHIQDEPDKRNTFCLIQRLEDAGAEVLIRDYRPDEEWNKPVYERHTDEELTALEIARYSEISQIRWATEKIKKYTELLERAEKEEHRKFCQEMIDEEKESLAKAQKEEQERIDRIKKFWK